MAADQKILTAEQRDRWATVLDYLVAALPEHGRLVLVDGADGRAALVADRLAARLRERGRPSVRFPGDAGPPPAGAVVVADASHWRDALPTGTRQLTVWVRTPRAGGGSHRGDGADAVVDLRDPVWPVLRHVDPALLPGDHWQRTESQAFFAARAGSWDTKFGADLPAYAAAITDAGPMPGAIAVDVGCGSGRALPALRDAVGRYGKVIGVDHTPQMLAAARDRARSCAAGLLLADACRLPFADAAVDVLFAAGLLTHLPDHEAGLAELARVTRPDGRLILFHPSGRAALAARHGRPLRPDEPLAEAVLRAAAARAGWQLTGYDDPPHRFHAVAVRR
jgi:SAM-dependent methyltransferase